MPTTDMRRWITAPAILIAVLLLLAFYLGKSAVYPQPYLWFLVCFVFLALILTKSSKVGIFAILISVFLLDWLNRTFALLPRQITWLKDASVLILLLRTLVLVVYERRLERTPIDLLVSLFVVAGLFSVVANGVPPVVAALGFRPVFKYILLFYIIVNSRFEERFLRKIVVVFLFIAFAQIPVCFLESFLWNEGLLLRGPAMNRWDFVTGTLPRGSSGLVAIFIIGAICMMIGLGIYDRARLRALFGGALLFVPLPLTVSRGTLLAFPLVLIYMLVRRVREAFSLRVRYALLLALLFITSVYVGSSATGYDLVGYLRHPIAALKQQSLPVEQGSVGRLSGTRFVYDYLRTHPHGRLLGVGPGVWSESFFGDFSGRLWTEFEGMPVSKINQVSAIMSEFGLAGLLVFGLIIYQVYRMNERFFSGVRDDFWRAISCGFSGTIFLYCVSSLYLSVWYADSTAAFFWILSATIFSLGKERGVFGER